MCCKRAKPRWTGSLPSSGSSVASQRWQSGVRGNERHAAARPSDIFSTPLTGQAGMHIATLEPWNPEAINPGAPYMTWRFFELDLVNRSGTLTQNTSDLGAEAARSTPMERTGAGGIGPTD